MVTETFITIGKVKALSIKENNKYSICLINGDGEAWFGDYGKPKAQKGDEVKIEFNITPDGQWRNIVKLDMIQMAPQFKSADKLPSIAQDNASTGYRESYAKDILVALIAKFPMVDVLELQGLTNRAIEAVEQIVKGVKEIR